MQVIQTKLTSDKETPLNDGKAHTFYYFNSKKLIWEDLRQVEIFKLCEKVCS